METIGETSPKLFSMPTLFEFITADGEGRLKPVDRSRIKSRCLQGRNKRIDSRRSQREARQELAKARGLVAGLSVPPPPPTNVAVLLPNDIGRASRETLHKVFACKSLERYMSPLAGHVHFAPIETKFFEQLFRDASFTQSLITLGSVIEDFNQKKNFKPGPRTYKHLRRTIKLLNDRLSIPQAHNSDSTLYVVLTLTMLAVWSGDWTSVRAHIVGLHKIVELRGGLNYLAQRPKLHFKLDRVDLACVMSTGEKPLFTPSVVTWGPIFPSELFSSDIYIDVLAIHPGVEQRVAALLRDFQALTHTLKVHSQNYTKWDGSAFQAVLSSIQARLLSLPRTPMDPFSECLRLGMLAFLATLSGMPGNQTPLPALGRRFRQLFQARNGEDTRGAFPIIAQWTLMLAAVCGAVNFEEGWFIESWKAGSRAGPTTSWETFQQQLESVLWINSIHGDSGRGVFEKLCA